MCYAFQSTLLLAAAVLEVLGRVSFFGPIWHAYMTVGVTTAAGCGRWLERCARCTIAAMHAAISMHAARRAAAAPRRAARAVPACSHASYRRPPHRTARASYRGHRSRIARGHMHTAATGSSDSAQHHPGVGNAVGSYCAIFTVHADSRKKATMPLDAAARKVAPTVVGAKRPRYDGGDAVMM